MNSNLPLRKATTSDNSIILNVTLNVGMVLDMFACESPLHENSRANVITCMISVTLNHSIKKHHVEWFLNSHHFSHHIHICQVNNFTYKVKVRLLFMRSVIYI